MDKNNNMTSFVEKNKKALIIAVAIIIAVLAVIGAYIFSVKNNVASWEDKIYPGVQAYGVDLSGKTQEEAVNTLNNELTTQINDKIITVKIGDKTFEIKYSDINPVIAIDETVNLALTYGKDQGVFDKNSMIKKGAEYSVNTTMHYDEEKLKEFEDRVNSEVTVNPVDATIHISGGNISITPEVIGKKIDVEDLHNKLVASIDPDPNKVEEISIELTDYAPKATAEALGKIDSVIGTYTDTYYNNTSGRITNMQLATGFINGTLLMPGDEFSYNKTIGETTPERGYKEANVYIGDSVEAEYGGGVCQISTALYRAVMRANLRSSLRYNHSMMVSYSKPSLDATVYEGDIDYRFINTYDTPVYIEGYMTSSTITFNVYGNKAAMGGKTYELVNEIIDTYDFTTEYIDDPTLEEGKQVSKLSGAVGYKSKGYLVTYENGTEVNRELISTDVYQPMNSIVRRGTKKVEQPAE